MNMDTVTAADQDLSGGGGGSSNTLYPGGGGPGGSPNNAAMSNPDLLRDPSFEADPKSEYPEHVLKVKNKYISTASRLFFQLVFFLFVCSTYLGLQGRSDVQIPVGPQGDDGPRSRDALAPGVRDH